MRHTRLAVLVLTLSASTAAFAQALHNDNSCDIGVAPAATLLLPFFNVDILKLAGEGETTIFTITNVSRLPQIAHVTIWTDWAYPLLAFNIYLTPYDVQTINLYDVIVRGRIASADPGPRSPVANPNHLPSRECERLPTMVSASTLEALHVALTVGSAFRQCGDAAVGGTHRNAIGYVTIDVVNTCSTKFPDDPAYLAGELLFDNVLIADYQHVDGDAISGNFAGGNPLVHIRAVPEGGKAGSYPPTTLPYTFYDRYTSGLTGLARNFDRRQPLPSAFAARYVQGGTGGYDTHYKIWREGITGGVQECKDAVESSAMLVPDVVRFDERENAYGYAGRAIICCGPPEPRLPAAAEIATWSSIFPTLTGHGIAGWMYLNLNNGGSREYSFNNRSEGPSPFAAGGTQTTVRASQNWVVVSMRSQGRYALEMDTAALGNGCTPASPHDATPASIGPAPNETPSGHQPH